MTRKKKAKSAKPQKGSPVARKGTSKTRQASKRNSPGSKSQNAKSVVKDLWLEKLNWWAVFGIALVLMLSATSYFLSDFLSHEKVLLYKDIASDSMNSYWPRDVNSAITEAKVESGEFEKSSWNPYYGMGRPKSASGSQPVMRLLKIPYWPVQLILGAFVPEGGHFMHKVAHERVIRIFGDLLFLFLLSFAYMRAFNMKKTAAILGSLMLTFCGYAIMGVGGWTTEIAGVIKCAMLLLSLELMLSKRIWYFVPIAVLLLGVNPRVAFYAIFGIIYTLVRYLELNGKLDRKFLLLYAQLFGLVLLGWIVKATPLISQFYKFASSPRVTGGASLSSKLSDLPMFDFADPLHYGTVIMRFFHNDLLGAGGQFKGWYNYLEAPTFYCGLVALLLVPQVFQFLKKPAKIAYASMLGIWALIIIFPYFRYAFYFFAGDYYKAALNAFIPATLVFMSMRALSLIIEHKKISLLTLALSFAALSALLFFPFESLSRRIDSDLRNVVFIFLTLSAVALAMFSQPNLRQAAAVLLILFGTVELASFADHSVNDRYFRRIDRTGRPIQNAPLEAAVLSTQELNSRVGFNDYTLEAIAFLDSVDESFFRINKEYSSGNAMHGSINDALIQGFYGTPSYSAQNHRYYIDFLANVGIIDAASVSTAKWAPGVRTRPVLHGISTVKYNLYKGKKSSFENLGFTPIHTIQDVNISRNPFYIPLGFCYDKYIAYQDYMKLSLDKKQSMLLRGFVADTVNGTLHQGLERIQLSDTNYVLDFNKLRSWTDNLKEDTLQVSRFWNNGVEGTITLEEAKCLYFSIPYDRGWKATVNGEAVQPELANTGFIGLTLPPGKHEISLIHEQPLGKMGKMITPIIQWLFILAVFMSLGFKYKEKLNSLLKKS